jgi:hypothetical protein
VLGRNIKTGTSIDGKTVARATDGYGTFYVARSTYRAPSRDVVFTDGTRRQYEADRPVPGVVRGYAEPLPAGGVLSRHVRTPAKVRASDGRWRGESVHGMTTRHHDMVAKTNMFDRGRVNGQTGAARGGVGPVFLTGQSFWVVGVMVRPDVFRPLATGARRAGCLWGEIMVELDSGTAAIVDGEIARLLPFVGRTILVGGRRSETILSVDAAARVVVVRTGPGTVKAYRGDMVGWCYGGFAISESPA